jgi:WD40 repeat protein
LTINNNKVASSSNDGRIFLWNLTNEKNIVQSHFLHRDAVKAIKWCPWKVNLLASGGGKNDHKIILWNT